MMRRQEFKELTNRFVLEYEPSPNKRFPLMIDERKMELMDIHNCFNLFVYKFLESLCVLIMTKKS